MSNHHKNTKTTEEMFAEAKLDITTGVGKNVKHESAAKQVAGEAIYIDDRLEYPNQLHCYSRLSDRAHARVTKIDVTPCYEFPGVAIAITAKDIPGLVDIGPVLPGDPLLADGLIEYYGQPVLSVAANDIETARKAAMAAIVEYEDLTPVLCVEEALENEHYVSDPHTHKRGDSVSALASALGKVTGKMHVGGQEHFYLETQIATAIPTEDGGMIVHTSTQNPSEGQKLVAEVLDVPLNKVQIIMRRMGGGFGGKETNANAPACIASVVARLTGRPTKVRLPRMEDMTMTGKRHPFFNQYEVGYNKDGVIQGIEMHLAGDAGCSPDLTNSIVDRAMFHSDNAYYLGDTTIIGYRCKTNKVSNTAYRGFGGPQGLIMPEVFLDDIARELGKDPLDIRYANLYGGEGRDTTHYYQKVDQSELMLEIMQDLEKTSEYRRRREEIKEFNAKHPMLKKGLALTPVKFGISFTATFLNQAGALVHIYTDGSIHLNHGGTEMGQGLNTKVAQIVAEEFQVDVNHIHVTATNTEKVPNTSPTAASSGTDLNGKAAQDGARKIKERLVTFAANHFNATEEDIIFKNNYVIVRDNIMPFPEFIELAYFNQISLSSNGFYRTPKIFYDRDKARGRPFYYFAYGAACSEVVVDTLTGEYKILQTDILHDVGASLNPDIDIGQVEGAFIQGAGWLTSEELIWNDQGRLMTSGPASYKIPAISDMPVKFNTRLVENRKNSEESVYNSKAVGEPPFMLGIAVFCAIRDAIASVADYRISPELDAPATPERVLFAIEALKTKMASKEKVAQPADIV